MENKLLKLLIELLCVFKGVDTNVGLVKKTQLNRIGQLSS